MVMNKLQNVVCHAHPALYPSRMICKRIVSIHRDGDGPYQVVVLRVNDELQKLECDWISDIQCRDGNIQFTFVRHFEESKRVELHVAFFNDDYSDLGDLPEY